LSAARAIRRLLVFGASGAIGGAVVRHARARGWAVLGVGRGEAPADAEPAPWRRYDPLADDIAEALAGELPFDGVAFAQGANLADSVQSFDAARHLELYRANCLSVIAGLSALHGAGLLAAAGARIAVVSSIWQDRARADKLSYTVTKAAIGGLVRSAAVDLGAEGHLVNGVLPGVLDTPMTAANVSAEQLAVVRAKTMVGRLPDLDTVADLICFLCSAENNSINGQSITVDLGMSNAHLL
jgi:hypothetical protein